MGSFYPSQSGGPNNTIYWITKALKKNGIQPIVVTTNDGIREEHTVTLNTWLETSYGNNIYRKTLIHYLPLSAFISTIKRMPEADVIHLTTIFYPLSWMIALVNRFFFKKKIVWSPRGELDPQALIYSQWKKKPILFLVNTFLKKDVIFHATCVAETNYIQKNFGENVSVIEIPNYLELPKLIETSKENYFIYLGRIHPKKAIENLISAIKISSIFLRRGMKLKIVGDYNHEYGRQLMDLVRCLELENVVEFLGHVEGIEKELLLAQAHFLIMPSHTENFGNVVVEALAQRTPVVASIGTPWGILEEANAGFWIDNSSKSIAVILDYILNLSEESYRIKADNALKLAQKEFNIEDKISQWIHIYMGISCHKK